jgi:TolA-binding protein
VAVQSAGDWAEALAVLRIVKKEFPEASEALEAIELFEKKRAGK